VRGTVFPSPSPRMPQVFSAPLLRYSTIPFELPTYTWEPVGSKQTPARSRVSPALSDSSISVSCRLARPMSSSLPCWDSDRLRVGLNLVRAVLKPCLRRSLLTSSSSPLDPSLGTTTAPSSSTSSSELSGPSTVRAGKPTVLIVGIFEMAESDLVDLYPSPPEIGRLLMVGSGIRMVCSVSNV
jgi:hypothetical protein